jgi:hypothetical protein
MFLSNFRRPPSSNQKASPSRNLPAATISGTSIARTRTVKGQDLKTPVVPQAKPNPPIAPTLLEIRKEVQRKEP